MQRNNIATRYPRAAKARLVRWREVDGLMPGQLAERAAAEWPELPPIHSSTWRSWSRGREYAELREAVCGEAERLAPLQSLWGAVADGGVETALSGTLYLLLRQAYEAADGELDVGELTRLVQAVATAQRAEIARLQAERGAAIETLEQEHAAEVAELHAQIAGLQADIERLINPDAGARTPEERIAAIRERLGIVE